VVRESTDAHSPKLVTLAKPGHRCARLGPLHHRLDSSVYGSEKGEPETCVLLLIPASRRSELLMLLA